MSKVQYIRKGFTPESLEMIEKVRQVIMRYDQLVMGEDYVKTQAKKATHSKYSDTPIMTKIILEGGEYLINKLDNQIMEIQAQHTRGRPTEVRKQLDRAIMEDKTEKPDVLMKAVTNLEFADNLVDAGIFRKPRF